MASETTESARNRLSQFIFSPRGVAVAIAGTLFCAKYIFSTRSKSNENPNTHLSSAGHDSLIPFTSKQCTTPKVKGDGHQFATVEYERIPKAAQLKRSRDFFKFMNQRRSFRHFSYEPVEIEVIRNCIATANTAPSGAHCSPWTFVVVADENKRNQIRKVVEAEEQINYDRRMKQTWVDSLKPIMNNLHSVDNISKPYLSTAPYLIIIFKQMYRIDAKTGNKIDNYYPNQSTGIAAGMLMTALHNANLASLSSTPMGAEKAIRNICGRKQNEKVFLLMPVGYPAKDATVPYRTTDNWRKDLKESMVVV